MNILICPLTSVIDARIETKLSRVVKANQEKSMSDDYLFHY